MTVWFWRFHYLREKLTIFEKYLEIGFSILQRLKVDF